MLVQAATPDEDSEPAPPADPAGPTAEETTDTGRDEDAGVASPDVFIPSEEVSEDLSVSFPVDI